MVLMIETTLINYGGIGILAAVMIFQNHRLTKKQDAREEKLAQVVANNTIVMAEVREVLRRFK